MSLLKLPLKNVTEGQTECVKATRRVSKLDISMLYRSN